MLNTIKQNPALASGLLVAVLNTAAEFGVDITARQIGALNILLAAVLALVVHASSVSKATLGAIGEIEAAVPAADAGNVVTPTA